MKVLVHTSPALWPMLEPELDIIQRHLDKGNDVTILYCDGDILACDANNPGQNQKKSRMICRECISRRKNAFNWLDSKKAKLTLLPYKVNDPSVESKLDTLKAFLDKHKKFPDFERIRDFFESIVPGVFESALSSLMTNRRESDPDINRYWQKFSSYLLDGAASYYYAKNHLYNYADNKTYIFNGRHARYSPMISHLQKAKKDFYIYEYPLFGYDNYIVQKNYTLFELTSRSRDLEDVVKRMGLSDRQVFEEGSLWFENRINRVKMGFEPVYSDIQQSSSLPLKFDKKKFNIVLFVSSQDEINSLKNYSMPFVQNQKELIYFIASTFRDAIVYVRMHPNLKGVDSKFNDSLLSLKNNQNIRLIGSADRIDSYELIRNADLVVTCSSTAGIEAAYIGTPSVMVGCAPFETFGGVLNIKSKRQFVSIVNALMRGDRSNFPLPADARIAACRYAFGLMNQGIKSQYFERNSYFYAEMVRGSVRIAMKASFWIVFINRLVFLPVNILRLIQRLLSNHERYLRIRFISYSSLKKAIFPEMPRR